MNQVSATKGHMNSKPEGFELFLLRLKKKMVSIDPYLTVFGIGLWLFAYWVFVRVSRYGALTSCQAL
jgi:hypothetical protein